MQGVCVLLCRRGGTYRETEDFRILGNMCIVSFENTSAALLSFVTDFGTRLIEISLRKKACSVVQPFGLPIVRSFSVPAPEKGESVAPLSTKVVCVIVGPTLLTPAFTIEPSVNMTTTMAMTARAARPPRM